MFQSSPFSVKVLAITLGSLALAIVSAFAALANVLADGNPGLAMRLPLSNGFVYGEKADLDFKSTLIETQGVAPEKWDRGLLAAAYTGFRLEPTSHKAIRMIAFHHQSLGRYETARLIMNETVNLTKRDDIVNFWLVQDSGKKDDLDSVLKYYDYTLRSSLAAKDILIPTMSNALADERFVQPYVKMLASAPPWADDFWRAAAAREENALSAAILRTALHRKNIGNPANNDVLILENLVKTGQFSEAFALYSELAEAETRSGNDRIHGGSFAYRPRLFPIDWRLFSSGEFGAEVDLDSKKLLVSSLPNTRATFASQVVHLPAAGYLLSAEITRQNSTGASPLYLRLRCAAENQNGRPDDILRLEEGESSMEIAVDAGDCEYFWLTLLGEEQDSLDGYDFAVTNISLKPM